MSQEKKWRLKDILIGLLSKVDAFSEDQIVKYLDAINAAENVQPEPVVTQPPQPTVSDWEKLKGKILSDQWAFAADPCLICSPDDEEEKFLRARSIIATFALDTEQGKKICDFGCGEGHVSQMIWQVANPEIVVGYDIRPEWNGKFPDKSDKLIYTYSKEELKKHAPFNTVFVYDVLDHLEDESPLDVLKFIKNDLLVSGGTVRIRFHPWCSRHGGHQYHSLNKAFVHLFTDEDQQKELGIYSEKNTVKITDPSVYESWISQSGFKVLHRNRITEPAGDFFEKDQDLKRILLNKNYPGKDKINYSAIETNYFDYYLQKL